MGFIEQASDIAGRVDDVFMFIFTISLVFLIFITFLVVYFTVRYSRERNPHPVDIEGHLGLEIVWTLVPLVLFLAMFYYGWTNFAVMRNPPRDAMVVEVTGRQWNWDFKYPNGRRADKLYAALDRPVKLELRSEDVLHGFFIPAFRVKIDVIPGRMTYLWFTPRKLGEFDIMCTVICGVNHSYMLSKVRVLPEKDYKDWYFEVKNARPSAPNLKKTSAPVKQPGSAAKAPRAADRAEPLLKRKACQVCHSSDGSRRVGPSFRGLFGKKVAVIKDGEEREVLVDEDYLRRSILRPGGEIRKGFGSIMPAAELGPEEIELIIGYIKELSEPQGHEHHAH